VLQPARPQRLHHHARLLRRRRPAAQPDGRNLYLLSTPTQPSDAGGPDACRLGFPFGCQAISVFARETGTGRSRSWAAQTAAWTSSTRAAAPLGLSATQSEAQCSAPTAGTSI
jgi:hypothetical protein